MPRCCSDIRQDLLKAHYPFANSCMEGNILLPREGVWDNRFIHPSAPLGQCFLHIHIIYSTNGSSVARQTLCRKEIVNYIRGRNTRCPEVTLQEHFTQSRVRGRPSGGVRLETETWRKDEPPWARGEEEGGVTWAEETAWPRLAARESKGVFEGNLQECDAAGKGWKVKQGLEFERWVKARLWGFGARKGSGQFQSRASSFETCRPLLAIQEGEMASGWVDRFPVLAWETSFSRKVSKENNY